MPPLYVTTLTYNQMFCDPWKCLLLLMLDWWGLPITNICTEKCVEQRLDTREERHTSITYMIV